ncbi:MAG: hypothetical protein Q8R96_18040 [Bacteroidota bacterium]|nr:hypothetical protein [Bacteroidota bacterium]
MIEKEYHYWFEPDERIEGLKAMFEGFDNAIKISKRNTKKLVGMMLISTMKRPI